MNIIEIIEKKANKNHLTKDEIEYFVFNYTNGSIADYQASSLLMAIKLNGMNLKETAYLTDAMLHSGNINDLSSVNGICVDKHSTGGVGDKTSIVLAPLVASCGLKMAKMSGRGLGHTGGTIDKLESISGFDCFLSMDKFMNQVKDIGLSIIGQTSSLCPADKKLYALRDVTGTIDSIPLICSSIVSKKLASGASIIELDVKYGSGAFMKTKKDAKRLASTMIKVGKVLGKNIKAVISNMNIPLGNSIGNSLEVIECIETLKGNGPKDLENLCVSIASNFLIEAKLFDNYKDAYKFALNKLKSGEALIKFKEFVKAQGGNENIVDNYLLFKQPKYKIELYSDRDFKCKSLDALTLGHASSLLGGGRFSKDDVIDYSAGIVLNKKVHDKIKKGELLATLYTDKENIEDIKQLVISAFR